MTHAQKLAEERYPNDTNHKIRRAFISGYNAREEYIKKLTILLKEEFILRIQMKYPLDRDPDSFWEFFAENNGIELPSEDIY